LGFNVGDAPTVLGGDGDQDVMQGSEENLIA
jgi:hypothetical protein